MFRPGSKSHVSAAGLARLNLKLDIFSPTLLGNACLRTRWIHKLHLQMANIPLPFTTIYAFGVGWTHWLTNKHHQSRFEKLHVMFHCSDWLLAFSPASRGTLIWNLEIKNNLRGSRLIWFCNLACLALYHIARSPTMPCKSIPSRLIDNKWRQTMCCNVLLGLHRPTICIIFDHFFMLPCHKHSMQQLYRQFCKLVYIINSSETLTVISLQFSSSCISSLYVYKAGQVLSALKFHRGVFGWYVATAWMLTISAITPFHLKRCPKTH